MDEAHEEVPLKSRSEQDSTEVPRTIRIPWLARRLGLSKAKTYALVASGELPAYRCGRSLLVLEADVVTFLDSRRVLGGKRRQAE